jgi:spermidine synthase
MTIGRHVFPSVAYANVSTPTYPCGALGFLICSLDEVNESSYK